MKIRALLTLLPFLTLPLFAQNTDQAFARFEVHTDSQTYSSKQHTVNINGEPILYFQYDTENEIAEIRLFPAQQSGVSNCKPIPSGDYEIIDTMVLMGDAWTTKVRFHNLTKTRFLKFQFRYTTPSGEAVGAIRLQPCTKTTVSFRPASDELFIGEEKVFELVTNNPGNLRFSSEWTSGRAIDYRLERSDDRINLHVLPNQPGLQTLQAEVLAEIPDVDMRTNTLTTQLPTISATFTVKTSRLKFLNIDRKDITLDEQARTGGVEIQLDNARSLEINKTYRVENQENPGGVLIAEIFTRSYLSNDRILCYLRTYNYHRSSDGYLYIKDGDQAQFISNFNITPSTAITKLSVMREGSDWKSDLSVHPGETISLKIEGTALYKARFHVEDLIDLTTDTLFNSENEVLLKLKVPLNISKKKVSLYNYSVNTGFALQVKEYEIPRPFDYIMLNYGDINRVFSGIHGPVLFEKTIRDVVITFNQNRIDSPEKLYGCQHLLIDVKVTGSNNELIDTRTLPAIKVCPGDNSPRYPYYDKKNSSASEISLNKYLRKNTSDLDDWSRITLTIKNDPAKSEGEGQQKELDIILKKKYKFDIDVSFPAGLVTVSADEDNPGKTSFSNLYGISMAMVAQFAFYHPDKIAKTRPYRIGAGFLALNAFNFQSEEQDLALVVLGSLYPTTRDKKLAFPLYIGGGYQFKAGKWMMLIGPGISIKL